MTTVSLRPYERSDASRISEWIPSTTDAKFWGGASASWPLSHRQLLPNAPASADLEVSAWTSAVDGRPVGYGQIEFDHKNRLARLMRIVTDPVRRGQGLGRQLVAGLLAHAFDERKAGRCELNVFEQNASAIALYRSRGFVVEGCRRRALTVGSEPWNCLVMGLLDDEYALSIGRR